MYVYIKLAYKTHTHTHTHTHFPATQKADENNQLDVPIDKQSRIPSVSYSFFFPQCRTIN